MINIALNSDLDKMLSFRNWFLKSCHPDINSSTAPQTHFYVDYYSRVMRRFAGVIYLMANTHLYVILNTSLLLGFFHGLFFFCFVYLSTDRDSSIYIVPSRGLDKQISDCNHELMVERKYNNNKLTEVPVERGPWAKDRHNINHFTARHAKTAQKPKCLSAQQWKG